MTIPAEFRGRAYKFKKPLQKMDPEFLAEIRKDFPNAEIGNLLEIRGEYKCIEEKAAIEFGTEEDYTAFILRYGERDV